MDRGSTEMPRYECFKKVWALKIADIDGVMIAPSDEGYAPFAVSAEYIEKHKPQVGGYYVVYQDGYRSYSPAEAFEQGYVPLKGSMSFSRAMQLIDRGKRLARYGWDDRVFVFLVAGSTFKVNREPLTSILGDGTEVSYRAHIDIRHIDGSIAVWAPSQTDMAAQDWHEVE